MTPTLTPTLTPLERLARCGHLLPESCDYACQHILPAGYVGTVTPPLEWPLDGSLHSPNRQTRMAARLAFDGMMRGFMLPAPARPIPCPRCHEEAVRRVWTGRVALTCGCGWFLLLSERQEAELRAAVRGQGPSSPAALVATWTLIALGLSP